MKALTVVDMQNDFVSGSLAVPGADVVVAECERLVREGGYDVLIATRDWHPAGHCSFSASPEYRDGSWPVHCVALTDGAKFAMSFGEPGAFDASSTIDKGTELNRDAYSGFDGSPDLASTLRALGVTDVDVVGLAFDYCVRATAADAVEAGFKTRVLMDATAPVTVRTGGEAATELQALGVELIDEDAWATVNRWEKASRPPDVAE